MEKVGQEHSQCGGQLYTQKPTKENIKKGLYSSFSMANYSIHAYHLHHIVLALFYVFRLRTKNAKKITKKIL